MPIRDYVDLYDGAGDDIENTVTVVNNHTKYHPKVTSKALATLERFVTD